MSELEYLAITNIADNVTICVFIVAALVFMYKLSKE